MNNDSQFEDRLRRVPLRQIPDEWRREILCADRISEPTSTMRALPFRVILKLWHELIWPSRRTWATFAALWLLVLVVNVTLRDPGQLTLATSSPANGMMMSWQQQERLLAELTEPHKTRIVTSPPTPAVPRPRSDRRDTSRRPVYA